ncbi:MAG: hypothetical protein J5729_06440 [Bacteroidaceae bacterium]|nr:hypothetical protein [Bacteroidaceae bacterium]
MRIIHNKIFPFGSYYAINLFGIVFSKQPLSDVEKNHEYIHTLQQREMLWIGFYLWYAAEWLIRSLRHSSTKRGYYNISFEREAYTHQDNPDYRRNRPFWAWTKHIKKVSGGIERS